jgi:SagB-type dehydrogenase family enzyme
VAGDRSLPDSSDTRRHLVERQSLAPAERGTVYERYHAATALVRGRAELARPPVDPPSWPAGRGSVPLTPGPDPRAYVEGVIRIRRSAAHFLSDPLAASDLAFVLEMAHAHTPLDGQAGVSLFVVVNRVEGLAPGLYRYDRKARALVVQRRLDLSDDLHRVCLRQDPAREAAVGIAFVAELGPDSIHASHRTYRALLVEAGSIAQRVYLAAEAAGVAARNLAAFTDDDLNRLLRIDGRTRAAIHLTMLGPGD